MNDQILFSVLIAQYNNGKFLNEAINSVKKQTYTNWEIIIVDDASTDNSFEIYKNISNDDKVKIFYNKENKGCGYTKSRCIEMANGEILGFLDPDDTITTDALELMVNEHLKDDKVSLVYSRLSICDDKLNNCYISNASAELSCGIDYLHTARYIVTAFTSFKKKLYYMTVGINIFLKRAVDQDLYLKLEEVGSFLFIDKPLYFYRIHNNQISLGENNYKAFYYHIKVIEDACKRRGIISQCEDIISDLIKNNLTEPLLQTINRQNNKNIQPSLIDIIKTIKNYIKNKLGKLLLVQKLFL